MASIGKKIQGALRRDDDGLMGLLMDERGAFPEAIARATPGEGIDNDPDRPDEGDRAIYHGALGAAWVMATLEQPFASAEELRATAIREATVATAGSFGVTDQVVL